MRAYQIQHYHLLNTNILNINVRIRKALWEIYILICSSPEFPLYAHTLSLEIAALDINKLRSYISVKLTSILKIVIRPRKIYVFILQCHIKYWIRKIITSIIYI